LATWYTYDSFVRNQVSGAAVDFTASNNLKLVLVTSSYTPSRISHSTFSQVSAYQVQGNGYTQGGMTIPNVGVTVFDNTAHITGDSRIFFQDSGGFSNARYIILISSVPNQLIAYANNGVNFGNTDGQLTLNLEDGLIDYDPSP
jgi:hypothetical protein